MQINAMTTESEPIPFYESAQAYAGMGWGVFPLVRGEKRPATHNGFKSASVDAGDIERWWGRGQRQNLAIATGNGLLVVDVDVKSGIDGFASLKKLEAELGTLPDTLTATTPSGGKHLFFRYLPELSVPCRNPFVEAVDVKSDGGYVAAYPSQTATGSYQWENRLPIAELPEKWLNRLRRHTHQQQPAQGTRKRDYSSPDKRKLLRELQDALQVLDAAPYQDWIKVGMALHSLGDDGFSLWDTWSQSAKNYDAGAVHSKWASFDDSNIQPQSIFFMAQAAGWVNPAKGRKPTQPVPTAQPKPPQQKHDEQARSSAPLPLPDELPPVESFDAAWLPDVLSDYVQDIAERMSAPPDFIAIPLLLSVSAVIGRKIAIRPQANTDWTETPNTWGMIIGRPGVMKSPSIGAALRPLKRLIAKANRIHGEAAREFEAEATVAKLRKEAAKKAVQKTLNKNPDAIIDPREVMVEEEEPPQVKRYLSSDSTPEALLEVLRHNPNGLLIYRDELMGLLKGMDREDRAEQRTLFLTGWNGNEGYTTDRLGRGLNLHVDAVCLSVLGGTQPSKIAKYAQQAVKGGEGDDGLLQRFALTVWADIPPYKEVDEPVDAGKLKTLNRLFEYLDELTPDQAEAQQDKDQDGNDDGLPYLRFDDEALPIFRDWRLNLEERLRSGELHPAIESHLGKYRKLLPSLALLLHLADRGVGAIPAIPLLRALSIVGYLETHANRMYASVQMTEVSAAKLILRKLKNDDLAQPFTERDIYRKGWTGLDRDATREGIQLLMDYQHLYEVSEETGGKPRISYYLNDGGAQHGES